MILNVLSELRQPVGTVGKVDVPELNTIVAEVDVRNLRGTAELLRTDRGLLVSFEGTAMAMFPNSR
jgi:hypothetical protein